ncbi:MAG: DUF4390 domain-containing protein [Gammaproteobacteria bacterium]|nr:DUF4390 domain-containing protein [Gammaproteobacteria bacterium]
MLIQLQRSRNFFVGLLPALFLLSLLSSNAVADGLFEIRSASTRLDNGVIYLTSVAHYGLSSQAVAALESGVALTFDFEIQILRSRRWRLDALEAELTQSFSLKFNALSQRYVLQNLNSGAQRSFSTLLTALSMMARVTDIPVIDSSVLEPDRLYIIRVRNVLDQQQLPAPLQVLAFWSDGYRLESDWFAWILRD